MVATVKDRLGLRELVAIGIGSMIGGGIFSVMGTANAIAGHATVLVFLMGGIIAMLAGYNYARLAVTYRQDGASYTYLLKAFPRYPLIAFFTGWSVIVGYIGTLALYAYTFGAYGAAMLGYTDSEPVRTLLAFVILVVFLYINLRGIREMGESEDVIVYFKVAIMLTLGLVGVFFAKVEYFQPFFNKGQIPVVLSGALVFVAFEGFQLITNSVEETANPQRHTPLAIYLSIIIVTLIYITLAIAVLGVLTEEEIRNAREYAIAEALKPIFGEWGFMLASLTALLATSSAINGTFFGASRMLATISSEGVFPPFLSRRNRRMIPHYALLAMFVLAGLFVLYGHLDGIIAFASMTFLLVSMAVSLANLRLHRQTQSRAGIVLLSLMLMGLTVGLMVYYLYRHEPDTLRDIGLVYLLIALLFTVYHAGRRRHSSAA